MRNPLPRYPTGWFAVAFSRDILPGDVRPLRYFGRDLVLYRGQSGRAVLMDAHCPHLGAHFGHGGTVEGDEIRCPFHHWRFGPDGGCTAIPWADRPMKVAVGTYPIVERNGVICAWHDAAGGAPTWHPPTHPLPAGREIGAHFFMDDVVVHVQEVMENNLDYRHLEAVHGFGPWTHESFEAEGPALHLKGHGSAGAGTPDGAPLAYSGETTLHGPGYLEGLSRIGPVPFRVQLLLYVTPVDEQVCHARCTYDVLPDPGAVLDPAVAAQIAEHGCRETERQFHLDRVIWAHKAYIERPPLSAVDGPIRQFRAWYSQFYPAA